MLACRENQARKRKPNPNFWVRISSGGVGVFHVKGGGRKVRYVPRKRMPLNIRIQWNAGTACVSECVLKTLASRGLRVGPSKTLRAQRLKKFKILKFSSEIENFKRATHHRRVKITSASTERQKRSQNLAPVLVIISGNSLVFSRKIITSTGFYRCCAPARQHQ